MRRHPVLVALTLTLTSVVAVAAEAQQRERRDTIRVERAPDRTFVYSFGPEDGLRIDMRRGRLGITVDLRPDAALDSVGARVSGVTPGGAADKAGVQTGDVITRLNGARLTMGDAAVRDHDDRSRPGMQLIHLASRLDPGDTVRLDLRRDSRNLTLTFVAEASDMDRLVERIRIPGGGQSMFRRMGPGPEGEQGPFEMAMQPNMRAFMGGGLTDLELVKVSAALAEGLGISEGLLVVDVGSDTTLGLRAGDVIVSIGGRRPTSPSHAIRILSTYDPGEAVSIEVMRQRRRTTVSGKLPPARRGEWRIQPNGRREPLHRMPAEPMLRMFERSLPPEIELRHTPLRGQPGLIRIDGQV